MDSVKAYIFSTVDKSNNIATLTLGNIPNTGMYSTSSSTGVAASTANSVITIYVAYKVSSTAIISSTHPIILTATMGCSGATTCPGATSSVTNTVTVISQNAETVVS